MQGFFLGPTACTTDSNKHFISLPLLSLLKSTLFTSMIICSLPLLVYCCVFLPVIEARWKSLWQWQQLAEIHVVSPALVHVHDNKANGGVRTHAGFRCQKCHRVPLMIWAELIQLNKISWVMSGSKMFHLCMFTLYSFLNTRLCWRYNQLFGCCNSLFVIWPCVNNSQVQLLWIQCEVCRGGLYNMDFVLQT